MNGEYLAVYTELGHGIHDAQKGRDSLGLLTNLSFVDLEIKTMMLEVIFDLLSIDIVHVQVCDCKYTTPSFVALRQLSVLGIEHSIEKSEIVRNLLVAVHVEAILCLNDGTHKIRHVEVCEMMLNGFCET